MDMDTGTNGLVEYTTVPGGGSDNDGYDYFAIDLPYQGLVTVAKPLDYERAKYYHLVIKATDTASNLSERLSSTTTLTVYVEDGDDQGPAFVYKGCTLVHGACTDVEYSAEVTSGLT
ncbi:cadherin-99C-like [Rhipicephalus sanguineus]|uniref:cadherin-99C-like n=1 Tax=Rhipicephalus sanguineus TaxID=34632 RepID=UPI001893D3A6|nr:cadherin-99C-like [Rhipicephalus sanguineus]